MDIIDLVISYFNLNKLNIYKEFIILSSISQLIRYKNHPRNNIFNYFIILKKYTHLIFRIIFYKFQYISFSKYIPNHSKKSLDIVIVYPNNDNWVLKGLSKDLESKINELGSKAKCIQYLELNKNLNAANYLFIQHTHAINSIKDWPYIIERSSVYISHLRTITLKEVEVLSRFKYVFCQSSKDQMRLYTLGCLPGRVINLPVGVDSDLFINEEKFINRFYDFTLSLPLKVNQIGSHYWHRKSVNLIKDILLELAQRDYKILLLGEGWESTFLTECKNIKIANPKYKEKNKFLNKSKFFLNLSLIEGGPVTILEAIASGCIVLSKDNGFSIDIKNNLPNSLFLLDNSFNSKYLVDRIEKVYKSHKLKNQIDNSEIYKNYSFKSLAYKIINTLDL